jgi:hypothetical protein
MATSGLFDHIWENMINPTMHNKLEKIHDYLVIRSKLVHDSWIREREAGTSCTSIASMLSDVLHNQK